jgi:hypothetical protein
MRIMERPTELLDGVSNSARSLDGGSHDELRATEGTISSSAEDLVDAVVSPGRLVRYRVPLEHTERRCARGSTKTCLALRKFFLSEFTAGDVEIDAKDAVRPDVCVAAEPSYRSIRHE